MVIGSFWCNQFRDYTGRVNRSGGFADRETRVCGVMQPVRRRFSRVMPPGCGSGDREVSQGSFRRRRWSPSGGIHDRELSIMDVRKQRQRRGRPSCPRRWARSVDAHGSVGQDREGHIRQAHALRACEPAVPSTHRHVLVLGPVGVGKTFVSQALGHITCRHGYNVRFVRADAMLGTLRQSRGACRVPSRCPHTKVYTGAL
jgi:hypothetical protein